MSGKRFVFSALCILAFISSSLAETSKEKAISYLSGRMDRYHDVFYIYEDYSSAGNHFHERGLFGGPSASNLIPVMEEECRTQPYSGNTCIKCVFKGDAGNWGGWCFLNGVFEAGAQTPRQNWGEFPNAGYNIEGATRLTFWARGRDGGERVEFFCGGIGRNPATGTPNQPHPDSLQRVGLGVVTLSTAWKQYTMDLRGKDLSCVLQGFGWSTTAARNGKKDIEFYLDEIQYDQNRENDPHFMVSYETLTNSNKFDLVMRCVAFTYDNALALLAFLASGDEPRAQLIADAFLYAQEHDRFFSDGRLRNAYQGGELILPPGWAPNGRERTVRMPGWYDPEQKKWLEDRMQVGTYAGNMGWAMLALTAYYEKTGQVRYLAAAEKMGRWLVENCRDERGAGGFTGGVEGWEPEQTKLLYKSTEHNLDLFAAFGRLHDLTKKDEWRIQANHALKFVSSMWDKADGRFWTGTMEDGLTIFKEVIPLDCQAWSVLAVPRARTTLMKALEYAESNLRVGWGYDYNEDCDGVWFEGTAQMAAAFHCSGQPAKARRLIEQLTRSCASSGGLAAADRDELTTGFYLDSGDPWLYFNRIHVAATAWLVLADEGMNPFWPQQAPDAPLPGIAVITGR